MRLLRHFAFTAGLCCLTTVSCLPLARVNQTEGLSWPATLASSQQAAAGGRYREADSLLAVYATQNPATREARETDYWRGLFKLDPSNRDGSLEAGVAWLDRYITVGASAPHYDEALTLRRIANQLSTLSRLASASSATQTSQRTVVVEDKSKDEEVQRLKAELAKANDELERIKKRLVAPKP